MPRKKKLPVIRRVKLETFIRRLGDQIFTVDFTKLNGEERTMNARLRVKPPRARMPRTGKGGGIKKKKLTPNGVHTPSIKVYDMQKRAYRQINLETVTSVRAAGKTFKVV